VQTTLETPLLRIRDATVRKGRDHRIILDRVSLEIVPGQHTAILGPNGSGKSSLIKLITHEYRPVRVPDAAPAVEIFGRTRWNVFELRSLMGLVSPDMQGTFTDRERARPLRGLDVVVSGFFASEGVQMHHRVTAAMHERASEALATLDAADLGGKLLHEMSTGEARRVLIARALVSDPPALLLDEPTGGLDMVARFRFLETVRGLAALGKTIVMVTHRLEEIIPEIRQVVLLDGGRVLFAGDKDEALRPDRLSEAYSAPLEVHVIAGGYYTASVGPSLST
jgi:iron complex transport system ATP-binding protein